MFPDTISIDKPSDNVFPSEFSSNFKIDFQRFCLTLSQHTYTQTHTHILVFNKARIMFLLYNTVLLLFRFFLFFRFDIVIVGGVFAMLFVRSVFPKIKPFTFGDTPVFAGQSAQVACSVSEGDAPLELSWTFDGPRRDVFGGGGSGVSVTRFGAKTSLLSIDNTDSAHRGTYTCSVSNRAGNASYSATLNVHGTARALHAHDADHFFFRPSFVCVALFKSLPVLFCFCAACKPPTISRGRTRKISAPGDRGKAGRNVKEKEPLTFVFRPDTHTHTHLFFLVPCSNLRRIKQTFSITSGKR